MKQALILCLFLAVNTATCFGAGFYFPPLQPVGGSNLASNSPVTSLSDPFAKKSYVEESNVSYPRINQVEHSLYGKIFAKQDILLRIARIEKSLFSTTYPNSSISQRVDNIIANFNQINQYPNISKQVLSRMEAKIFNRNFNQNDSQNRIERLEQQIFGATQSGEITSRYENLKTAVNNYTMNQNPNYYQNPLVSTQGGWKGVVGNLGGMLLGNRGVMTGFTPSMDPLFDSYNNNSYSNGFNNMYNNDYNNGYNNFASVGSPNGNGYYNGYRSNRGYRDVYRNFGSQSHVTILD